MPNIQLKTGKTIYVSAYEYYFMLNEEDIENFFESCVADDLGEFQNDPFANGATPGRLEFDDVPDVVDPASLEDPDF